MASLTSVGRNKRLENSFSSLQRPSNKKRKVSFNLSDQNIEQLNDVTFVSGVNLKEEEEELFCGPNFKASVKSEHVEEKKSILNKNPLRYKLVQIMSKFGLKTKDDIVEQCLSLAVKERMRGLIDDLIRFSKQRIDAEKSRHGVIITSDIKFQIMALNQKAKDEQEKKLAIIALNQKAKDQREKKLAVQEKIPKMPEKIRSDRQIMAANGASRAALGGEDLISKWKLMAGQKHEAAIIRTVTRDHVPTKKTILRLTTPTVTVKDVVSLLEMEPQMCKSVFMYRLYEKTRSTAMGKK